MQTVYSKTALKFLAKLEKKQRDRIRTAISGLTATPPQGDIKLLQGYRDTYRLRVGSYRVIYRYAVDGEVDVLLISDIGNRGDIYK